jgi:hypothetical protein
MRLMNWWILCGGTCRPESPAEAVCDSDRGYGKKHDVLHKAYFLLNEGFGVAHTRKQTVVARFGESSLANLFFGDEELAALRLRGILRAIGEKRLQALLDVGCDVDGEGRPHICVEAGVEDLKRAMRKVGFPGSLNFGKPADEAGLIAKRRGGVVVRVAALPVGQDDDAGAQAAENSCDLETVLVGVLDVAVRQVEGFAVGDVEDAGSGSSFGGTVCGSAAGAGFALREVENAGAPAASMHGKQSASAGLLDVIAVGGDGEDVDRTGSRG